MVRRIPIARCAPALLPAAALALGLGGCDAIRIGLPDAAGTLPVEIRLRGAMLPASLRVSLDGRDVTDRFGPAGPVLVGRLDDPPPGPHRLSVVRSLFGIGVTTSEPFDSPSAAPPLVESIPAAGEARVSRGLLPNLRFDAPLDPGATRGWGFGVECAGQRLRRDAYRVGASRVVLAPAPELPAGATCRIVWRGPDGVAELPFSVAPDAPGPQARAEVGGALARVP